MKIFIIGAGFSGISAAAYAAKSGHEVHVFDQLEQAGGRARQFQTEEGFVFDMGPSWYWMPDIIESFFMDFGVRSSDFFALSRLDPQVELVFQTESIQVPDSLASMRVLTRNLGRRWWALRCSLDPPHLAFIWLTSTIGRCLRKFENAHPSRFWSSAYAFQTWRRCMWL